VESIVLGLAGIIVGALVAAFGVRVFYVVLALFAFVAGFLAGGQFVASFLGEGLLATGLGWVAGLATGVLLAVLSVAWFWIAVVVLAAAVGSALAGGILAALGVGPGPLTFLAGLALGIVFAIAAVRFDAPTVLVAVLTSFVGAAYGLAGAYLLIGAVAIEDLAAGPLAPAVERPLYFVAWGLLSVAALAWQLVELRRVGFGPRLRPRAGA
jgi:hypothetical protein